MRVVAKLVFIAAPFTLGGCTSNANAIQGTRLDALTFDGLKRAEYRVLDKARGEACGTYIGLWPIPVFWIDTPNESGVIFGHGISAKASDAATYRAIAAVPNADAILTPVYHVEERNAGIWYSRTCVTVRGKAIEVKSDEDLARLPPAPPAPPPNPGRPRPATPDAQ
jgi:hypothetical protein